MKLRRLSKTYMKKQAEADLLREIGQQLLPGTCPKRNAAGSSCGGDKERDNYVN